MLDEIDPTGEARDGLEDALGTTRAGFLLGLLTAAAGVAGSIDDADAGTMAPGDVAILRFDLQFEYLQATMYTEAVRIGHLSPKAREVARVVGAHEWAHAHALRQLLGHRAVHRGHFDYHGVTERESAFIKTAVAFEDLTTALLKYQALRLRSKSILSAAASLHSVEARHAAWMRRLAGRLPTSTAFDQPIAQDAAKRVIVDTGFISRDPTTNSDLPPGFTG
jgi:ferritin-like protein